MSLHSLNFVYLSPRQKCENWKTCWLTSCTSFLGSTVAMGAAVVALAVVVIVDLHGASDTRVWTRQAPWYVLCARAVCVMCREFAAWVYV